MYKDALGTGFENLELAETVVKSHRDSLQLTAKQRRLLYVVCSSRHGECVELVKCAFDNPLTKSAFSYNLLPSNAPPFPSCLCIRDCQNPQRQEHPGSGFQYRLWRLIECTWAMFLVRPFTSLVLTSELIAVSSNVPAKFLSRQFPLLTHPRGISPGGCEATLDCDCVKIFPCWKSFVWQAARCICCFPYIGHISHWMILEHNPGLCLHSPAVLYFLLLNDSRSRNIQWHMAAYLWSVLSGVHLLSDSGVLCFILGILFFKGVLTLELGHRKYFLEQGKRKK